MRLLLSVLVVLVAISMVPAILSESPAVGSGDYAVPHWIKNTAGWWAEDKIPDSAFIQGIQFLIKEEIIVVQIPAVDSEAIEEVPSWVKNTAGWWAEDKIHDIAFVNAIRYLVSQGIIIIEQEQEAEESVEVVEPVEEVVEINDFYMIVNGNNCCANWAYVGKDYKFYVETFDKKHGNPIDGVTITVKIISKGGELRDEFVVTTEDGISKNIITIPSMDWYAENILSVTGEYYGVETTVEKEFTVFATKSNVGTLQSKFLLAKDSATDGMNSGRGTFGELNGAHGVDTFTIGGLTYAIVTSQSDDGVQIINISDPTTMYAIDDETDGANSFDELDGPRNVATYTITSATASDLSLSSTNYAIVAALADNGLQVIDIGVPTAIVAKDSETDNVNGFDELVGAHGVATFTISSNSTYRGAIVTANTAGSVMSVDITNPTAIFEKDVETDGNNSFAELSGPRGVATFTIGATTYAIVVSQSDNGVQMIDISNPAAISAEDDETDGANGFTELKGAFGVDTFTIGTSTYAIVASVDDDGVQIIDISDPTAIVALDAETDEANGFTELDGASDVSTFTCGKRTYAMVTANVDDGIQLIDISNPTNIVPVTSNTDEANGFTGLDGARNITMFTNSSKNYAIVTSHVDDGVQIIEPSCGRH